MYLRRFQHLTDAHLYSCAATKLVLPRTVQRLILSKPPAELNKQFIAKLPLQELSLDYVSELPIAF